MEGRERRETGRKSESKHIGLHIGGKVHTLSTTTLFAGIKFSSISE